MDGVLNGNMAILLKDSIDNRAMTWRSRNDVVMTYGCAPEFSCKIAISSRGYATLAPGVVRTLA